jgi:hypothetical protein
MLGRRCYLELVRKEQVANHCPLKGTFGIGQTEKLARRRQLQRPELPIEMMEYFTSFSDLFFDV